MRAPAAIVRSATPLWGPCVLVTAVAALGSVGDATTQRVVTTCLVNLVLVVGIYIFVGNSGRLSFGHIAFAAIGAYASALLTIPPTLKSVLLPDIPGFLDGAHLAHPVAALLAGLVAMAVALLVAYPIMRMAAVAVAISTLSLLVIVNVIASNWTQVTRGTSTMTGIPLDTTMWVAFAWVMVAIVIAFLFQRSARGLSLRASREDEAAAMAIGVNVVRERVLAFAISAFVVAIGGHLLAHQLGSISPNALYLNLTFVTIAMLVVGGMKSLAGAVSGVVVISVVSEVLRRIEGGVDLGLVSLGEVPGLREVVLAAIMLAVLALRPAGLTGGREFRWPTRGRTNAEA